MPTPRRSELVDLQDAIRIDKYGLDEELVRQPATYLQVANGLALHTSYRDQAKDDLKQAEAEADQRVRARLEKNGVKITEPLVEREVDLDRSVGDARQRYRDACLEADKWSALRDAWLQRSYALKDLVQLHVSAYNTTPTSTAGSKRDVDTYDYAATRGRMGDARRKRDAVRNRARLDDDQEPD